MSTAVFFFLNFINLNRLLSSFRFHSLRRSFHRTVQNFSGASTEFFDKLFFWFTGVCLFVSLSLSFSVFVFLSVCLSDSVGRSVGRAVGLSGCRGGAVCLCLSLFLLGGLSPRNVADHFSVFVFVLFLFCSGGVRPVYQSHLYSKTTTKGKKIITQTPDNKGDPVNPLYPPNLQHAKTGRPVLFAVCYNCSILFIIKIGTA